MWLDVAGESGKMKRGVVIENILALFVTVIVLAACIVPALPVVSVYASGEATFTATELLCRPTDHSVTINVVAAQSIEAYFQYGTASGVYTAQTSTVTSPGGTPVQVVIDGLSADTQYYYRMVYRVVGLTDWVYRNEYSFHTQREPGSSFAFTIISDSHMNGGGGTASLYKQTLNNVLVEHPDFHIDLGDTFWMDGVTSSTTASQRYVQQRVYMGAISSSVSIFVSVGNHEQEEAWHLDDTGNPATSPPVLSANARKEYFPNPVPDAFYSGNTEAYSYLNGDHLREDYYAWTWGDALFVVIDPFWYTTTKPYIGNAGGGESSDMGSGNRWDWTLGLQQFNWLKQTLESSDAKFKFVFDHHVVGGAEDYVRGGAGSANLVEWGGYNEDGVTWGWDANRPVSQWGSEPIHQIMVENYVTAYFHGHDHLYAYEVKDGVVYQEVPSPSMTGSFLSSYYNDPYKIKVLPSPGHIRVTVTPTQATVDYVATSTGTVSYSYTINANWGSNPPAQPSSLTATAVSTTQINLGWRDNSGDETGFKIEQAASSGGPWSEIADVGPNVVSYSNTGLTPSTTYYYRVYAYNSVGNSGYSNIASATTMGPDYSISVSPNSLTIQQGGSASLTITVTSFNGFNSVVNLVVSGCPTGATCTLSPTSVTPPSGSSATSTLSINAGSAAVNTYALTVTGTSGSLTHSATVSLAIKAPPKADFSLSASGSLNIMRGRSGASTITVTSLNGFNSAVKLSVSGLPWGVSYTLTPLSVKPSSGGSVTSKLTVVVSLSTLRGTYTIRITGTSGLLRHTVNIILRVS
jgi:hypothetical protein